MKPWDLLWLATPLTSTIGRSISDCINNEIAQKGGLMLRKIFLSAGLSVMLFIVMPTQAATITVEQIDVNFAGGFNATGSITFTQTLVYPQGYLALASPTIAMTLNGTPLLPAPHPLPGHGNLNLPLYFLTPPDFYYGVFFTWPLSDRPPTHFSEFLLDGVPAISGTVTCGEVDCDIAATPLPAALPLFGAAVTGFAAFARRRRKSVQP
ncbi:MAG: VPLPA-CTERM sorting domain-containing protein [Pseudolabrys sp.]